MTNLKFLILILSIFSFVHCEKQIETHLETFPLIPIANSVKETGSAFFIKSKTILYFDEQDSSLKKTAIKLKNIIEENIYIKYICVVIDRLIISIKLSHF